MTSKYKEAALARGKVRTGEIERRVWSAIEAIKREMQSNEGIYPHNGGAVSKNEIARRAGIGKTTLFAPRQSALNSRVDHWLQSLKQSELVGRVATRRNVQERAEAWRAKYRDLESSHRKTELDLQAALADYHEALALIARLQTENVTLLEQLAKTSSSRVASIIPSTRR